MTRVLALVATLGCVTLAAAETIQAEPPPNRRFQLRIPEEGTRAFIGERIELTRETVEVLEIDILNPTAQEIQTDRIYSWINGNAASTVSELRRSRAGLVIVLDLGLREDLQLVQNDNTVEIVAENHRGRRFYESWVLSFGSTHHGWFSYEFEAGARQDNPAFPEITVLSPVVPPTAVGPAEERMIDIRAKVASHSPIAAVRLNDIDQPGFTGRLDALLEARLPLSPDRRELVLEVVDESGNHTRVGIPVMPMRHEPAPRISGSIHLLSIGISRYSRASGDVLPYLPRASDDAVELARRLTESPAVRDDALLVLRDGDASLARVQSALRDFASVPRANDFLVIYFAGYGLHGSGSDFGRFYLATSDTRPEQLRSTALDLNELTRLLDDTERIRTRNVLLLFDVAGTSGPGGAFRRTNMVNARLLNLASPESGRAVLVSAAAGEKPRPTRTPPGGSGGLFMAALSDGLAGAADLNRDRVISVAELSRFVSGSVSRQSFGAQTPRYRMADEAQGLLRLPN